MFFEVRIEKFWETNSIIGNLRKKYIEITWGLFSFGYILALQIQAENSMISRSRAAPGELTWNASYIFIYSYMCIMAVSGIFLVFNGRFWGFHPYLGRPRYHLYFMALSRTFQDQIYSFSLVIGRIWDSQKQP